MKYNDIFENIDSFLDNYSINNIDKVKIRTNHKATPLSYLLSKRDKNFIKYFKLSALKSYSKNGKIEFPLESEPLKCHNCGKYLTFILNNNEITVKDNECFNEKIHSVNISIPSGKLILADWPRFMNDIIDIKDLDINTLIGRVNQSKNYEKENIMHFFVGNTSPFVSQKGNEINIEYAGYDEENNEEIFYDESFEFKDSICTELWWVTGIDFDLYNKLLINKFGENILSSSDYKDFIENCLILNVEPGEYECTSYYELLNIDDNYIYPKLFIKIDRYLEQISSRTIEDDKIAKFNLFIYDKNKNNNGHYTCSIEILKNNKVIDEYFKKFKFLDFTEEKYKKFVDNFCENVDYRKDYDIKNEIIEIRDKNMIDEEVQQIVKELNKLGLITKFSCQGTKDEWSDRPCKKDGHSITAYIKFEKNLPEEFVKILKENNQIYLDPGSDINFKKNNSYNTIRSKTKEYNTFFSKNIENAIDKYKKLLKIEE